jgi:hypothetical protein
LEPIVDRAGWPQVNTEGNELRLVERLKPSTRLAGALARIAFLDWIPPAPVGSADSRPYARMLLAEQGDFAAPWKAEALTEIGGDTRLGTSAAYLAVSIAPVQALPKVERAMAAKLELSLERQVRAYGDRGDTQAIRPGDADRIIELAYALSMAGAAADRYSGPLLETLDHGFARPAPPFGLLVAKPKELCRVAVRIGGHTAQVASRKPACREEAARSSPHP